MKDRTGNPLSYCLRNIVLRLMCLLLLFPALARAPLAYDCLPGSTADTLPVLTAGQGNSSHPPCQDDMRPPPAPEREHCCIIDIDYGASGHGAVFQSFSVPGSDQADAVLSSNALSPAPLPVITIVPFGRASPATRFRIPPTYLVTRRLRI